MNEDQVISLLKDSGVIIEGHFLLTSGRHSGKFLQCSQLLQHPLNAAQIGSVMARPFLSSGVQTVIGPAMGGVILAYEVARSLGTRAIYAEKLDNRMVLTRGFSIKPKEKVLLVEDAVATGGSVMKVLDLLHDLNADIVGVSIIVDRTGGKDLFPVRTEALIKMDIKSYPPDDCPLCQKGTPLTKPKGR